MGFKHSICTIGSHTALQILKGARDEGFTSIVVCEKGREEPYDSFGVADKKILVDNFRDFPSIENRLLEDNSIVIPHASFIEYVGLDGVANLSVGYFGNKNVLAWESDRESQRQWLKKAGLLVPERFLKPADIDRSVIVKFHGARGGRGYSLAKSPKDFGDKIKEHTDDQYVIQEYIIGVPMYVHYFYSPLTGELEIMSFDIRYESNVDSIGRISARDQIALQKVDPSYVVVGNTPVVVRESLLPYFFKIGRSVIDVSREIDGRGLFGPFCLEGVLTPDQEYFVFEISARIVAGTNLYINGSPYSDLKYPVPMSTGRRIAREIKMAVEKNELQKVLG